MPLGSSQKSQQEHHGSPVKVPIILAKNEKAGASSEMRAAGRLWKPQADSDVRLATSPKHSIPSLLQSGELPTNTSQPSYKIQQRNDLKPNPGADWTNCNHQSESIKIIDEYMNWTGDAMTEFLLEHSDYRVMGVLGAEGVGKSYVLNMLATHPKKEPKPFLCAPSRSDTISHSTMGVNAFVTADRVILLDCQPLFSASVLEHIITNERRFGLVDYNSEDICDSINMELTMFMLSVCHIVFVVENWFTDPNMHKLLQSVEMLKPPQLSNEKIDDHLEFTSKLVFVQNMQPADDVDPSKLSTLEASMTKIYGKSSLHIHKNKASANVKMAMIPISTNSADSRSVCKKYEDRFVQDMMSMNVSPILHHTTLSEKNWFQYACKMWDAVKKSPFLQEYMRLLI